MKSLRFLVPLLALFSVGLVAVPPARAADDDKVPYWASVDTDLANLRVGPGDSYRIDWVYRRPHLPVKVLRREGPWRLIEDPSGSKGWMRDILLSRQRGGIVKAGAVREMRAQGNSSAPVLWHIEPGVVGLLGPCKAGWCGFETSGHKGFIQEDAVWGTGNP